MNTMIYRAETKTISINLSHSQTQYVNLNFSLPTPILPLTEH